jgi:uncharacterized repeat protein (TIGR04138 family)
MSQLEFADDVLSRIRERTGPYHERAFLFVLASLEHLQQRLPQRRHVAGEELAHACRELALEQFGLFSRTVLEHWGIRNTADIGAIVYTLIDVGLLKAQESDRIEHFEGVFSFAEAFEARYPWGAWREGLQALH